jgi:ankyrin repeat protein
LLEHKDLSQEDFGELLVLAAKTGNVTIFKQLFNLGRGKEQAEVENLRKAFFGSNIAITNLAIFHTLFKKEMRKNGKELEQLNQIRCSALQGKNLEIIEILQSAVDTELNGRPDEPSQTTLFHAAEAGLKVFQFFWNKVKSNKSVADFNSERGGLTHRACNDVDVLEKLHEDGADFKDTYGHEKFNTPLHCTRSVEVAKFLIENKVEINAKNILDQTPLVRACAYGNLKMAEFLIDANADVDIIGLNKASALGLLSRHLKICLNGDGTFKPVFIKLLQRTTNRKEALGDVLVRLVDLYVDNNQPCTEFVTAMKFLIEHDADINAVDPNGVTPLIKACFLGKFRVAEALIDAGADVNILFGGFPALGFLIKHYQVNHIVNDTIKSVYTKLVNLTSEENRAFLKNNSRKRKSSSDQ